MGVGEQRQRPKQEKRAGEKGDLAEKSVSLTQDWRAGREKGCGLGGIVQEKTQRRRVGK